MEDVFGNRVEMGDGISKKGVSDEMEGFLLELPEVWVGEEKYVLGGVGFRVLGEEEFRMMLEGLNMGLEEFCCWIGGDMASLRSFVDEGAISQEFSDRIRAVVYLLGVVGVMVGRCR